MYTRNNGPTASTNPYGSRFIEGVFVSSCRCAVRISNLGRILKGQRLHACVQKCSQQEGGVGTRRDDGWKTAWFCCYLCDICPVRRICAGRRAPVSVGRAWLCALLPVHGYVTFLPGQMHYPQKNFLTHHSWFSRSGIQLASFPGYSHLQYLIACSMQIRRGKAWEIWSRVVPSGRQVQRVDT